MRIYHNSRKTEYRYPQGALELGREVRLGIKVSDTDAAECICRVWRDGEGETLIPMEMSVAEDALLFTCTLKPENECILWYHFIVTSEGETVRLGAAEGKTGGEGAVYHHEPPSFQMTVYKKREIPAWYKNAVVYQIFPDVFARGEDFEERAKTQETSRKGPERKILEDWHTPSYYEKDEKGRVTCWPFHGGTLKGIEEKLPMLRNMGVTALYLNPIFEAASCHRYDTADYMKIDPLLGDEESFRTLCRKAEEQGISVILDGVFNHTGCDSVYFDKYGNYGGGALNDADSPYRKWFSFDESPIGYDCWWGVDDLPNVNENEPSYREYITGGEGVVRKWLKAGAKGFRLDVADELPDEFIKEIKTALTAEREDGVLLGEVWEDASNKISYGKLRRYFLGDELDATMNYPFRTAILDFLTGKVTAEDIEDIFLTLKENYPKENFYACLNMLGSHDRPRTLSVLGTDIRADADGRGVTPLDGDGKSRAKARMWLALITQMTFPGVPCIYYGDEAGVEGGADPDNRAPYPWGREDGDCLDMYRNALFFRKNFPVFTHGEFEPFSCGEDVFGFYRYDEKEKMATVINRSLWETKTIRFRALDESASEITEGRAVRIENGKAEMVLPPLSAAVIRFGEREGFGKKMPRGNGVLCHITSVPNGTSTPNNISVSGGKKGDLKSAYAFVDFLRKTGQRYWQILPVSPTDVYGSPYAGLSAFAGNIGLIGESEETLRRDFANFTPDEEYKNFVKRNEKWLVPYAVFASVRAKLQSENWQKWPENYQKYTENLQNDPLLKGEIEYNLHLQYRFDREWTALKKYANACNISIIGDLPMFVSELSADVWKWKNYFKIDKNGYAEEQAGVPPDYFAEDGQLWGNPVYDWARMEENGFDWWLDRLERAFYLYDYVRLDHFRGFEAYWSISKGKTAKEGRWTAAPGAKLFERAYERFGKLPVIAEDLGTITPSVRGLLEKCGFYGIDVLQFTEGDPFEYEAPKGKIVYSGTHDNDTLLGWCKKIYGEENGEKYAEYFLDRTLSCGADVTVLPLQDILHLGNEARMNVPGTKHGNWQWQADEGALLSAEQWLKDITYKNKRSTQP